MRLPYTINEFTPERWERVFDAFLMANRSHQVVPYEAVMATLRSRGRFESTATAMGTWSSRLALTVQSDGHLDAEMELNGDLSAIMRRHLERMKRQFEEDIA